MFKVTAWTTVMPHMFGNCVITSTFETFAEAKRQKQYWERAYDYVVIQRI